MVARCRSCCIHKETSRFLHWWLSVHTCFQIALNGIGQVFTTKKKKKLNAVEVRSKISEVPTRLFLYQLPHTAAFLPTLGFLSSLNGSVKHTA